MINIAAPIIGAKERQLINEVLDSRILASGKFVEQFENKFAAYCGTKFAIANVNGTAALHTALLSCGVKAGDKVATTSFSFIATANSILFCGAKPIFVDINPDTFNINPIELEKKLKKEKIKAVIIVHLYGCPCDMDAILRLKKKYKFILIEDCAQAHGAEFDNKRVGSFGDVGAFSFYATKNMMTGEGGMVISNSAKIDKAAKQIINHGRAGHSQFTCLGYNFRMTNLAAAIGISQLEQLDEWTKRRAENAAKYNDAFKNLDFLQIPIIPNGYKHVFHQYTLRIKGGQRSKFMQYLNNNGVGCGIYYDTAMHRQPFYQKLGYKAGISPAAEKAAKEVVSIPVHPSLSSQDTDAVISVIKGYKK